MPVISFANQTYELESGETVLEGMERLGVLMESGCRSGICHSCKMVALDGAVPADAQAGLNPVEVDAKHFLACRCIPTGDMEIAREDSRTPSVGARVSALANFSHSVKKVDVQLDSDMPFRPGQFFNVVRADGLTRSYSAANLPGDGRVEFHVRRIDGGVMTTWIHDELALGDRVTLQGPFGHCVYSPESPDEPLLLAGTGTGLAPLLGILLDALKQGHLGPIHLFHGALTPAGLYARDLLADLAGRHAQLSYVPCVMKDGEVGLVEGDISKIIVDTYPHLKTARIHLCGDGATVKALQKKLFLSGARLKAILADAFND